MMKMITSRRCRRSGGRSAEGAKLMLPSACSTRRPLGSPAPEPGQRLPTPKDSAVAQILLDAEELVVLCDPVRSRGGAGLDLAGVRRHGKVGDGGVFRLPRAVGDDGRVASPVSGQDR